MRVYFPVIPPDLFTKDVAQTASTHGVVNAFPDTPHGPRVHFSISNDTGVAFINVDPATARTLAAILHEAANESEKK